MDRDKEIKISLKTMLRILKNVQEISIRAKLDLEKGISFNEVLKSYVNVLNSYKLDFVNFYRKIARIMDSEFLVEDDFRFENEDGENRFASYINSLEQRVNYFNGALDLSENGGYSEEKFNIDLNFNENYFKALEISFSKEFSEELN